MASSGEASRATARWSAPASSQWRRKFAITKPPPPVTTAVTMSACHPSAVDHEVRARDVAGHVARQKEGCRGDILGFAEARPGRALAGAFEPRRVAGGARLAGDDLFP